MKEKVMRDGKNRNKMGEGEWFWRNILNDGGI